MKAPIAQAGEEAASSLGCAFIFPGSPMKAPISAFLRDGFSNSSSNKIQST
jgi:hypothetical protein